MIVVDSTDNLFFYFIASHCGFETKVELLMADRFVVLVMVGGKKVVFKSIFCLCSLARIKTQEQLKKVDLCWKLISIIASLSKKFVTSTVFLPVIKIS